MILTFELRPFFLTVSMLLLIRTNQETKFCSAYCDPDDCSDIGNTDCTGCVAPFILSGSTCVVDSTTGYVQVATDSSTLTVNESLTGSCSGDSSYSYTFYGNMTANQIFQLDESNGVQGVPFYQLRLIFWTILIDNWDNDDFIIAQLTNTNQVQPKARSKEEYSGKLCGNNGNNEDYVRFDKTFTYNQIETPLTFTITTNGSSSLLWGAKDFILLANKCHEFCTQCTGSNSNQCSACNIDLGYKLSGTTCADTCLDGYGDTFIGQVCVYCDLECEVCFETSNNCSSCTTSGQYEAFLLDYNSSCQADCPIGYFQNHTTQICDLCNLQCISCHNRADYCYQCDLASGYAWREDYTCNNPCPINTFSDNGGANCSECSPYCIECVDAEDYCLSCQLSSSFYESYLLNNSCLRDCPISYYKQTNNNTLNQCLPCYVGCYECTNSTTPCTVCNQNYYLYESACGTTCPEEYFTDEVTWTCLLCSDYCVKLTIQMYFTDNLNKMIYIDMGFTEDLDFSTFPMETFQTISFSSDLYSLDMFNFVYKEINSSAYRISIEPKGYMFLYNVTIDVTTLDLPDIVHEAANGRPFNQANYQKSAELIWYLVNTPDLSDTEKSVVDGLATINDAISSAKTQPYVQEIFKMGVFCFFFGGAQITSSSLVNNNILSQNLYQGARFFGMAVFFDVPPWEQNSRYTKYVIVPPVEDVVNSSRLLTQRKLFNIADVEWRFERTGHTSFFIFDTYLQILLIVFCWILLLIGYCINKNKPLDFKKYMGKYYSFLHKVHEICIFYVGINTVLEWMYFESTSLERWLSLGSCILATVYFLVYQLYIYYDLLKYPTAALGNQKYQYYAIRYGSYLKNIRYEQYDMKQPWSPKVWFRPYNYHILSYYKKLMMVVSLPLFYDTTHAQISVLICLQLMEMIRFCVTWPFCRLWRNIYRLILECALMMFFITVLIQGFLIQEIMRNDDTLSYYITIYHRFGWVGFTFIFFFNIGFLVLLIVDICIGCKKSNRQLMDQARRIYYYDKLKTYEEENEDVPLNLVNKWVKLGNLNQRNYDELDDINLRVQYFRMAKVFNKPAYEIQMKKLLELYMNIEFNYGKENNVNIGKKVDKRFTLTKQKSKEFFYLVDDLWRKYSNGNIQYITLKTFQKVEQSLFKPGEKVDLKPEEMNQKIQLETYSGEKKVQSLPKVLKGFPLSESDITFLK